MFILSVIKQELPPRIERKLAITMISVEFDQDVLPYQLKFGQYKVKAAP